MNKNTILRPDNLELVVAYATILLLVSAYAYAGSLFMPILYVAICILSLFVILLVYSTKSTIEPRTDKRIMLPILLIGSIVAIAIIINYIFIGYEPTPAQHTLNMLKIGIPVLAATITQIIYLRLQEDQIN